MTEDNRIYGDSIRVLGIDFVRAGSTGFFRADKVWVSKERFGWRAGIGKLETDKAFDTPEDALLSLPALAQDTLATLVDLRLVDLRLTDPRPLPEGVKYDAGKPDWTLVPFEALAGVVRVMQKVIDAGKYPRDNWRRVENGEQRYKAGGMRHRFARLAGESHDPETGELHIDHELCCLIFERWFAMQVKP